VNIRPLIPALALIISCSAAKASTNGACGDGLVCASNPETIVQALQEAGYQAQLERDP
jgi:hypothetical protein